MKKINENDIVFETEKLKSPLGILQGYTSKWLSVKSKNNRFSKYNG